MIGTSVMGGTTKGTYYTWARRLQEEWSNKGIKTIIKAVKGEEIEKTFERIQTKEITE